MGGKNGKKGWDLRWIGTGWDFIASFLGMMRYSNDCDGFQIGNIT